MRRLDAIAGLLLLSASLGCGRRAAPSPPARAEPTRVAPEASATAPAAAVRPPVSPESARRGDELAKRAYACFEDPRCAFEEATKLYLQADDLGATEVSCFRFYYGIGVPADLVRARACFERAVGRETDFAGSSPRLERVFLGLMLLDGQGGARDRERGEGLFVDCLWGNDSGVSAAARSREASGAAKPIDFCKDIGGTTLDTNRCAEIEWDAARVDAQKAAKEIVAELALDDAGLALWTKAERAWNAFIWDDGKHAGDSYRGGSMRIAQETWIAAALTRERVAVIRALLAATPAPKDGDDALRRAEERANTAARDAENRKLYAEAEAAWRKYRAAETAFVRRAFAPKYGGEAAAVRRLDAEILRRRAAWLEEHVKALGGG